MVLIDLFVIDASNLRKFQAFVPRNSRAVQKRLRSTRHAWHLSFRSTGPVLTIIPSVPIPLAAIVRFIFPSASAVQATLNLRHDECARACGGGGGEGMHG